MIQILTWLFDCVKDMFMFTDILDTYPLFDLFISGSLLFLVMGIIKERVVHG